MEALVLEVEKREGSGKGFARRTRAAGRVPAVFYGGGQPACTVSLDARSFGRMLDQVEGSHLIELKCSDADLNARKALLREVQQDPLTGALLHADLFEVDLTKQIEVKVALHFEGKAAGVSLGGILQPLVRELAVECLPTQIPESITVDVSALEIHSSVHVNEVPLPDGCRALADGGDPVVTVLPPTVDKTATATEETEEGAADAPAEGGEAKPAEDAKS